MNTPLCDFVRSYAESAPLRLHMPGHKGDTILGAEPLDITEIPGADSLFEATGILAKSEKNASKLFGAHTFYSAEGSSLSLRAMLFLACLSAKEQGKRPVIAAGRNAHKTFLSAAALLDFEIRWLTARGPSYLTCPVTPETLEEDLNRMPNVTAVYVTSPDYLGNTLDLEGISALCKKRNLLFLCDNAHGAYLKFLSPSRHPMDLGADLCCDSAHKTLPVLTGGAYLHLNKTLPESLIGQARSALALFASTSPSYLILQSLDAANRICADTFPNHLSTAVRSVEILKQDLLRQGFSLLGDEPLKLTVTAKTYGYTGTELSEYLATQGIVCEFADPDAVVMMFSPTQAEFACRKLQASLSRLKRKPPIRTAPPAPSDHRQACSVREAMLSPSEELPVDRCIGRILASPSVGCPPAVPIAVCGEELTEADTEAFRYYGIRTCRVVKK